MEQMNQKKHKPMIRKTAHRMMTILLAVVVLVMSIPTYPAETAADGGDQAAFKKINLWRWERVCTVDDARKKQEHGGYCIIFWGGDNRDQYFAVGKDLDDDDDLPGTPAASVPGMNGGAYGFYTRTNQFIPNSTADCWAVRYHKDYKGQPRYVFYASGWGLEALHAGAFCTMEFKKCYWEESDLEDFSHCVTTSDKSGSTYDGCVRIWRHDGTPIVGSDEHLMVTGSGRYIDLYESGLDDDRRNFHLFFGEEVPFTLMPDVTVPTGTTMKIEGHMMLDEECTITVQPGAVLTIAGEFINNGSIINRGTVVVQSGARMYSAILDGGEQTSCGTILCVGAKDDFFNLDYEGEGNLVILENAQVILPDTGSRLFIGKGASCVNNGVLVLPDGMILSDGQFINGATGITYIAATAQRNMYNYLDIEHMNHAIVPSYFIIGYYLGLQATPCMLGIIGYGTTTTVVNNGVIYSYAGLVSLMHNIKNNGEIHGIRAEYIDSDN